MIDIQGAVAVYLCGSGQFLERVSGAVARRIVEIEPNSALVTGPKEHRRVTLWIRDIDTLILVNRRFRREQYLPGSYVFRGRLPGHEWTGIGGQHFQTLAGSRCYSHRPEAAPLGVPFRA